MTNAEINIRDPFILRCGNMYYMYGTRAKDFGIATRGFDVYTGTDLENWSEPKQVFYSEKFGLNKSSNWAPEVHEYKGKYYMFATFEQPSGNRGTYSLVSDTPDGEFSLLSKNALTPSDWMSLDGTLYIDKDSVPYLVFCHEHVQILNGTVCFVRLSDDLSQAVGEPQYMFSGSEAYGALPTSDGRYVTDGPFMYRGKNDRLYMIWSTTVSGKYYQCIAYSDNSEIDGNWIQLEPVFTENGGHGMIFADYDNNLRLTLHCPNIGLQEKPVFFNMTDTGKTLAINE